METSPPASSPDASPMRLLLVEAGAAGESRIRALRETGLAPDRLELEITERIALPEGPTRWRC